MSKKILVVCDRKSPSVSLQQIPQELKKCFKAREGYTFVGIDFGQQEYRTLANLSQDKNMIAAFTSGEDFYKSAASKIYGVPVSEISKEQRSTVKTVFIATMYGIGATSISKRLGISQEQAQKLLDSWSATFPEAAAFKKKILDYARRTGKAPTYFGRLRDFGDPSKRPFDVANINEAFSTCIQGTSADLSKIALAMLYKHAKANNSTISVQLHDEYIIEVPESKADKLSKEFQKIMEDSVHIKEEWIPYTTSMHIGKTWFDCSKD